MRLVFFVLLLVNAVLFVWAQGLFGGRDEGREPERLQRQLAPEKLHLLPGTADAPPTAISQTKDCRRVEWLSRGEGEAILNAIAALPSWEGKLLPRPEDPTHWVMIPELPDLAAAEKKKAELRKLGINESEIIQDATQGPYVVSLGVFRNPALAEERLQSLVKKGVRSARLGKREMPPLRFALELRAPTDDLTGKLPGLIAGLPETGAVDCVTP